MSNKMQVTMKLDQRMMMSQQLRQAITLLQYNTLDLKLYVKQCLETNPLIEVDESELNAQTDNEEHSSSNDDYNDQSSNYSADFSKSRQYYENEDQLENYAVPESLREHLLDQTLLCQFDEVEQVSAVAIIDAIDDNGYMTMPLADIAQTISSEQPSMEILLRVLNKIQTFDPMGVASRDIRECLSIQLNCLTDKDSCWELAKKIIDEYFEVVSLNNTKKMLKLLNATHEEYSGAMSLIRTLNPYPGIVYSNDITTNIEPELYVKKIKNKWQVFLSDSILTNIKINSHYRELIKQNKKHGSYQALKQELEEARSLLKGLKRRNETLFLVASHIVELQNEFLDKGPQFMKPLNIVDVSSVLNLHESTVSRITTGKYILTDRGVYELKFFFPSHVTTQKGGECSAIAVKSLIKEIIDAELDTHILSDEEIASQLKEKGINIARRTVAKYREAMRILPSYQRMRMQPA